MRILNKISAPRNVSPKSRTMYEEWYKLEHKRYPPRWKVFLHIFRWPDLIDIVTWLAIIIECLGIVILSLHLKTLVKF